MGILLRRIVSFTLFFFLKLAVHLFYRTEARWVGKQVERPWKNLRLFVFINHTSLFEPLYISAIPVGVLWSGGTRMVLPGADKTLNRPIAGRFLKLLYPYVISISRKRDATWEEFLSMISPDSVIGIVPEGRMMRANGLDLKGKPMNIRGGIADVLAQMNSGTMVILYSGGLHHVQIPGSGPPKLFKTLHVNLESLDIAAYKAALDLKDQDFKEAVVGDLEERKKKYCPKVPL